MKRMVALLLMVMMLFGCAKQEHTVTEPLKPDQPEPTEQLITVDESVFYFSNESEYGRLYSQRYDGTDLNLVVDTYAYNVRQVGASVYYLDGKDLCRYHIPTGEAEVFIESVIDYAVDGDHLVYYRDLEEWYKSDVRYRNLQTGEDISIELIMNAGNCDIADGILYYSKYDMAYGDSQLYAYNLETRETKRIAEELISFYRLCAVPGGVYFEGTAEDYTFGQYYASADGSVLQKVEGSLTENCEMFWACDDVLFCVHSVYEETGVKTTLHRHNGDGTVTEILNAGDNGYFTAYPLSGDRWLVMHVFYDSWEPVDAKGGESYFVYRVEYFCLDQDGNVTRLDATGELGRMFAAGDFPVIDSSTARKPVTADLYSIFVANHGHEGAKPLCSTTHGAWLNIADRKVDLAFLAAPTDEEMAYLNERGVSIEMKLYGGDGLVFIGNAENPVQNLTHEQIIGIYRGEIKNWNELGGPDEPIIVYYRDDQSGSQRLFEKMVFKGLELPDYESLGFWYMDEMSTIVDIVIDDPYAIGYSIMTYLEDVYENENLKVFSVNGVAPSVDSVKNSTYPYHTQGFIVIRSDEPDGSPARRLYDWFGSPVSDEMLIANGITPLHGETGIG